MELPQKVKCTDNNKKGRGKEITGKRRGRVIKEYV